MRKSLIFSVIFLPLMVFANASKNFEQTIKKYQKAKLVSMKVDKTVKSELLDKETVYKGQIKMANGKFRWENEEPEKTILLFDGKTLMNVQYPPKDFKGPVQVAKSKIDQKTKKQILISSLMSPTSAKSNFKVLGEKEADGVTEFSVAPEGEDLQIKNLIMKIEPKSKKISQISYQDDVGNVTILDFSDVQFHSKGDPQAFQYKIPKDAQVTDL